MKSIKTKFTVSLLTLSFLFLCISCDRNQTSDDVQQSQQEKLLNEGTAQTGMPNITHFRERKMLKTILELRDQDGLTTYTYFYNEMTGKLVFFGETIGYGIPYATQYTNPQRQIQETYQSPVIAQADPNGLFSPASAEGTWVLMKNPTGAGTLPIYIEPRIIVSPFKLNIN